MADMLMSYISHRKDPVAGFEFSNEPNLFPFSNEMSAADARRLSPDQFSVDIQSVRSTVDSFAPKWKLLCCDVAYVPLFGEIWNFTGRFSSLNGLKYVDETTFHFYPLLSAAYNHSLPPSIDPFYADPTKVLDPLILDQVGYWADRFAAVSSDSSTVTVPPIVLGETASAVGGGQDGLSNRFADVFEYVDKIGQMTARGHKRLFRQTLCGSPGQYYALISHDLLPSPSYYATALLNQELFGGSSTPPDTTRNVYKVLRSDLTSPTSRAYCVCSIASNEVGIIFITLH